MIRGCKLAIPAKAENAESCLDTVQKYCRNIGFNVEECFRIEVALAEAINNILEHALPERPDEYISVFCQAQDSMLVIEILDNGKPLTILPDDQLPDWHHESGRGWPIIYRWMDEVSHRYTNNQNQLILKKLLSSL